jgi:putative methyltransferase
LLVLPPAAELHTHALVANAGIILQDKASCLAPAALRPRAGELVLDCCAAPGNKTTQLAALVRAA